MGNVLLARYGEIALKGGNRGYFEGLLARNIRRSLIAVPGFRLQRVYGRIYAEPVNAEAEARVSEAADCLKKVFGLVGVAVARKTLLTTAAITEAAVACAEEAVAGASGSPPGIRTFKIDASRSEKRFPLDSMQLNRELGGAVLDALPALKVDVHKPDLRVTVEVRQEGAFVYAEDRKCPGGLPVGMSGRVVSLLSGGIDSPVASWLAMKRGMSVDALHFETPPFTSAESREKVVDLCRTLSVWGGPSRLHVVNFTPLQRLIWGRAPAALRITIMRRQFMKIAERIAEGARAEALVTGDSVGQVASQTLTSMRTIEDGIALPVLRPLLAWDKSEIVMKAREIGTYEISIRPFDDCCAMFVPEHPATKPGLAECRRAEEAIGAAELEAAVTEAITSREVTSVRGSKTDDERTTSAIHHGGTEDTEESPQSQAKDLS